MSEDNIFTGPPSDLPADNPLPDNTPRYCLRCRTHLRPERLHDLAQPHCPRCRLPYDPANPETWSAQPMFLRWRHWLPGTVLAIIVGVISYLAVWADNNLGWVAFLGVPFAFGILIGYLTRLVIWLVLLLALFVTVTVGGILVFMGLHGIFCGAILAAVFIGPAFVGALVGWGLRFCFTEAAWDYRRYYLVCFCLVTVQVSGQIEKHFPPQWYSVEVRTEQVFPASAHETWESLVFYEQVEHEPPIWLTVSLPQPLGMEGDKAAVGARQSCVYDRGHLVKEITELEEDRLLGFRVVEQHLPLEGCRRRCNDFRLKEGSFRLEPIDAEHTRVVLTTRYERRMRPGWALERVERTVIGGLHEHCLEGMRRRLEQGNPPTYPKRRPVDIASTVSSQ